MIHDGEDETIHYAMKRTRWYATKRTRRNATNRTRRYATKIFKWAPGANNRATLTHSTSLEISPAVLRSVYGRGAWFFKSEGKIWRREG